MSLVTVSWIDSSADWNTRADIERRWQPLGRNLLCIAVATLAAYAGSVAPPVAVLDLPQAERASLHLSHISAEAAPGVAMTPDDLDRIVQQIAADIHASSPDVPQPANMVQAKLMKITITRYDDGNSFAGYGGMTTIRDVEKGFARSVATTITQKA